jgi:DNA-binding transcriptional ArsR family regulator
MRTFKFIRDPKAFEVVADPTRRKIIYLLRAKDQTVSQLAESLNKTPQAIYHQIRKLLEAGLVEVAREERVDHFIETYYRATAEVFEFHHGATRSRESVREITEGLEALEKVGIFVKRDKNLVDELTLVEAKLGKQGLKPELEEKISQLEEVGFMTKQHLYKYAQIATMSEKQFEEMIADERKLRALLTSNLIKKPSES